MSLLINFAVKVAGGSGCLFNIHSDDYMYVLTAKHVITSINVDDIEIYRYILENNGNVSKIKLDIIGEPFFHPDPKKDAAIIKIQRIYDVKHLDRIDDVKINNDNFQLAGFPDTRSDRNLSIRLDGLKLKNNQEHGYIEAQLDVTSTFKEIEGQSGGGIYKIEDEHVSILGIQKKMSAKDDIEQLGRIEFMPIGFFDEIVDYYYDDLKPITKPYFTSFLHLKEHIAKLEGCFVDEHITYTRNFLRNMTHTIVSSKLTPIFISNFFNERLLVYDNDKRALHDKKLWIAWLEFLIIMNIFKDELINETTIEDVFNNYRLIYSSTEKDWSTEIKNIIRSDYRGLKIDGKVIISTASVPAHTILSSELVSDIIRYSGITKNELQIDSVVTHPLINFKLLHLHAFEKNCITNKYDEYKDFSSLNEQELINKLRIEYDTLFR